MPSSLTSRWSFSNFVTLLGCLKLKKPAANTATATNGTSTSGFTLGMDEADLYVSLSDSAAEQRSPPHLQTFCSFPIRTSPPGGVVASVFSSRLAENLSKSGWTSGSCSLHVLSLPPPFTT